MRPIFTPLILVPLLLGASVAQGAGIQSSSENIIYWKESSEINADESHRNRKDEDLNESSGLVNKTYESKDLFNRSNTLETIGKDYTHWNFTSFLLPEEEKEEIVDAPAKILSGIPLVESIINIGYLSDAFIHFATRPE